MLKDDLKLLGFTDYEIAIYITLLKEGPLKGTILSRLSGVPHGKTYVSALNLQKKGFITIMQEKPKIFQAIGPEIVVKDAIKEKLEKFREMEKNLLNQLKGIQKTKVKEPISERIALISGEDPRLYRHVFGTARRKLRRIYTCEERHFDRARIVNKLLKKGVKVEYLITKITKKGLHYMAEDKEKGLELKYYPIDNLRLVLKDDKEAIIQIKNPKDPKDRICIYVQSEELTKALNHYFDNVWRKAKDIEQFIKG